MGLGHGSLGSMTAVSAWELFKMDFNQAKEDDKQEEAIFTAISALDSNELSSKNGWDELDILSSQTIFEGIEAVPGGVVVSALGRFEAAATVYVTLNYGPSKDSVSMSDSYPAIVRGTIDNDLSVEIDDIAVDTESFYKD